MSATAVAVVAVTVAMNAFSGIAALLHWKAIPPGMAKADVPELWLTFPIGTLKTAGAARLLAGLLLDVPWLIAAAAVGLALFFVCALYTHVRAADYTAQFGLAVVFLGAAAASLVLTLTA
ncbi:DoxX family protein [Kribbella sp. NPDC002412]